MKTSETKKREIANMLIESMETAGTGFMLPWVKSGMPMNLSRLNTKDPYYYGINNLILWREKSYIPTTMMCLSFQFQKHLSLGRGGMILLDNHEAYEKLSKMVYDGRKPNIAWKDQYMEIDTIGYHYYMTPETAQLGIKKFNDALYTEPRKWTISDWPDLSQMEIFK